MPALATAGEGALPTAGALGGAGGAARERVRAAAGHGWHWGGERRGGERRGCAGSPPLNSAFNRDRSYRGFLPPLPQAGQCLIYGYTRAAVPPLRGWWVVRVY